MGMVTEMRLPGPREGGGERFNYRGMHRYLITLLPAKKDRRLDDRDTVLSVLNVLRESCRGHGFDVYAYTFLPDRLVLIIRGKSEASDMKQFLADFRARSATAPGSRLGNPAWARRYQERVLRKTENTRTVADGVFLLAVKAGLAVQPSGYEFQGSFVLGSIEPVAVVSRPPGRQGQTGGWPQRRKPLR